MVDSQAILVAPPGEGKSFVALSFALCVAAGREWLGHKVKQGRVVYVAAEGGRGMHKRVRAWRKEHDIRSCGFDVLSSGSSATSLRGATSRSY